MLIMKSFTDFIDKKVRMARKQLNTLKKVFESNNVAVTDFIKESDPYIFIPTTNKSLSFDGIRIYRIGDTMAFRVQKEADTHPYGQAYLLDIESVFNEFIAEKPNEEDAGKRVIKYILEEVKRFFEKTQEAEDDIRSIEFQVDKDPYNVAPSSTSGTDYANQIYTSRTSSPL